MMPKSIVVQLLALLLAAAPDATIFAASTVYHVKPLATGSGDGLSWGNATTLQDALGSAADGAEIWVAAGIYRPGAARADTFNLVPGVAVYGGFDPDDGVDTFEERDWVARLTVLSGDIDVNDTTDIAGVVTDSVNINGANSYHVVTADGSGATVVTASTILDGFTITAGQSNGNGGGFYCIGDGDPNNIGGDINECSPSLKNIVFSGNSAFLLGGAMSNQATYLGVSSPTLMNVTFSGNSAGNGGGISNNADSGGTSNPQLTNVVFSFNTASVNGGAMYNFGRGYDMFEIGESSPILVDVQFTSNSAASGGAMYSEGQASGTPGIDTGQSNPSLTRVTFESNSATNRGGAMSSFGNLAGASNPVLVEVNFIGNMASSGGAMSNVIENQGSSFAQLTRVDFTNNSAIKGGAMYNFATLPSPGLDFISFTLTDVTFTTNTATGDGGALYSEGSFYINPTLSQVTFTENSATSLGGAMYTYTSQIGGLVRENSPLLTDVHFIANSAASGGAMFNWSRGVGGLVKPQLNRVSFIGNSATTRGGAIYNTSNEDGEIEMEVVNALFFDNTSTSKGGAIAQYALSGGVSTSYFTNATFAGNTAGSNGGGALYNLEDLSADKAELYLANTIVWGNSSPQAYDLSPPSDPPTYSVIFFAFSLLEGETPPGPNNLDGSNDPLFIDEGNGDLHLQLGSPVIDEGANDRLPAIGLVHDLDGNRRIEDGSGIGSKIVDLGAYEFPPGEYTLTCDGTGTGTGTTAGTAPSIMNCTSTMGADTGTCSEIIEINTDVVLTATPASGSAFLGWVGCDSAVGNVCTQSISNGDETVQPIFRPAVIFISGFE
jgi:predicted outer membrane repeat protein